MKKKHIATSILLIVCLVFTSVGISSAYATVSNPNKIIVPDYYEVIEPHGIGDVSIQLTRRNATSFNFRAIATSWSSVRNTTMSTTVVPQRLENGRWVNRGTPVSNTVTNALEHDFAGIIDVRAYGSGTYRVRVTFSAVTNGVTTIVGPVYSFNVIL